MCNLTSLELSMKRNVLLIALTLCVLALMAAPTMAFHDAGVARCNACHTMHNSEDGVPIDPTAPNGNPYLLLKATASDMCLSCHASSRGAVFLTDPLAPNNRPGGNFVFLLEDQINDGRVYNPPVIIPGHKSGHSIVAPSRGVVADPVLTQSPGGNYPSGSMSCTSCHDPHGNQNFRLLYGVGHVEAGNYTFTNPAPVATAISYNSDETNALHTAYKSGMSGWCGNCHGNYHNNNTALIHPSGMAMGASTAQIYNLYNGTDNQTGGTQATAYLAAVPFEDPANTTTSTAGPTASSQVMCLSCHRSHATSAPNSGRWDFNVQFMNQDGVNSGSYAIPNPYGSANQRSLCNKCHRKDIHDGPYVP